MADIGDRFLQEWSKNPSKADLLDWFRQHGCMTCRKCKDEGTNCSPHPFESDPLTCLNCTNAGRADACSRRPHERDYRVCKKLNLDRTMFETLIFTFFTVATDEHGLQVLRPKQIAPQPQVQRQPQSSLTFPTPADVLLQPKQPQDPRFRTINAGATMRAPVPVPAPVSAPVSVPVPVPVAGPPFLSLHPTRPVPHMQQPNATFNPFSNSDFPQFQPPPPHIPAPNPDPYISELESLKAAYKASLERNEELRKDNKTLRGEKEGLLRERSVWESQLGRAKESVGRFQQENQQLVEAFHQQKSMAKEKLDEANARIEILEKQMHEVGRRNDWLKRALDGQAEHMRALDVLRGQRMVKLQEELQHARNERDQALLDVKVRDDTLQRERAESEVAQELLKRKLVGVVEVAKEQRNRDTRAWVEAVDGALTNAKALKEERDVEATNTSRLIRYRKRDHKFIEEVISEIALDRQTIDDHPMQRKAVVKMFDSFGLKLLKVSKRLESEQEEEERPRKRLKVEEDT
ncbi:rRNA-processing protein EBP2 [Marasmius crinis-equi]|uniref:rRNA-processing protein EBP2 n=1 Tax=Marasmius crinis-equi TaxID=585013 RepID=A0ABR3EWJ2_9AGAR